MSINLRQIIKKVGITQQELADYLGISRQYLNSYLDETLDEPKIPDKYLDNILFLFDCKSREELYAEDFSRSSKVIKKRMGIVRSTKESIDNLFNIDYDKKIELFKMVEYFQILAKLDKELLESFTILMENLSNVPSYQALLSYIGKKYLLIDLEDQRYNREIDKCRDALLNEVFEADDLKLTDYEKQYEKFVQSTKKQNSIDLEALKQSLSEMGYTNISQKEIVDLLHKYNEIKKDKE